MPRGSTSPTVVPFPAAEATPFGRLLREWRTRRGRSQLDLGLDAEVSARHISFLETGRSRPSRAMVLLLGSALEVPLRDRNALLRAAGFAPAYRETALGDPAMAEIVAALRLLLKQHEPFPARVLDRHWNLVMVNDAYLRILGILYGAPCPLSAYAVLPEPRLNVLRVLFEPGGLRERLANWAEVAGALVARVRREAAFEGDRETRELLEGLVATAGFDEPATPGHESPGLVIPVELDSGATRLRFFTTIATLGAAQDVTLAELRIEAFHPRDATTEAAMRDLAGPRADQRL